MRINRDQIILSRKKQLQFSYHRAKGHILSYLRNRAEWYYFPRFHILTDFPNHVDLEISSACDLKCPMCYTRTDEFIQRVPKQFMDFALFKRLVDECVIYRTYSIRISLRGEPFLHPEVIQMIRYAKNAGIKEVASLTNNYRLTPEMFEQAMKAGLDWLTISFDGLGETYERIRQPSKFEESANKIKEYKRIKDKAASIKPVLKIQSVWPAIKDCAVEYYGLFEPYVDMVASNPLIDYLQKDKDIEYLEDFDCPVLYQRIAVSSGGIAMCPNDELGECTFGDATRESLHAVWHGEKISKARWLHREHLGYKELVMCQKCYLPRKTQPVVERIGGRKIEVEKYIGRVEEIGR
ncbi:radical SAM/SPASM domain-containing protein [Chloroflexota bacterium]